MNQIGDYIHYKAENYKKFGITHNDKNTGYNYEWQRKKIKNQIDSLMTMNDKEGLENILNRFFSPEDRSKIDNELLNGVKNEMSILFGDTLGKIDMEKGNISSERLQSIKNKNQEAIRRSIEQSSTYLNTIYSRLNAIEFALIKIQDSKKYSEIKQQVNEVYAILKKIINDGKKQQILTPAIRGREFNHVLLDIETINKYKNSKGENIITILNTLIKNSELFPIAVNLQKGTLFEYLIAAAPAAARLEAGESLDNAINDIRKSVKGGERSKIEIDFDKNNFTNQIDAKKIASQIKGYSAHNNILESWGYSQHKLDVEISWSGQSVPISAKNVNLSGKYNDVYILTGSSLLYLLQDEDADFVNNYFNIIADHPDGKIFDNLNEAHDAAKITILFKALTGKTFGRDKSSAEVFVINDNSKGKVMVFDMKDLLNKAYNAIDNYSIITANGSPLKKIKIANKWANTYSDRITDFIMNVHQQKINASLKSNIFKT